MPVYRKHGKPEYTYDFQLRGRRFSGPTGTSNRRQAERILEQKREEARAKLKAAASFTADGPMTLEIAASRYWLEVGSTWQIQATIIGLSVGFWTISKSTPPLIGFRTLWSP